MSLAALFASALVALVALATLPLVVPALRRALVSRPLLVRFRQVMPRMSQTERDALEAGTVSWDGELFSGAPSWPKLFAIDAPALTAEERRFLDEEVETLCAMVSDWETTSVYRDLPAAAWRYIRERGFLGMIIPKEYGGLGFSAYAHSQVVTKLSTRCASAAVTVLVPNSLGPGELLLHYGTDAQKRHYLPRLAHGLDIPCFALTNPYAGSDAASIPDYGVVCEGEHERRRVLGLRVSWDKRYITLGPVATLLGLAFRAYDPDHLLGERDDLGITCALIPTAHPGVEIGRRHMPLNAVFQNGPTRGRDVFIPLEWVIGGAPKVGKGWRMLMECLAAGRGISLPSSNTGMAKLAVRATGAYARVRTQFKLPIGRFEGVEEALARMGANLYAMDATRTLTAALVDDGEKPSVLSGIAKLHITERARQVVNDAMDIAGGKGICMGPSNFLGAAYMQMPVSITVEGANILTRSLIVFGQGAVRCHPYVLREMAATQERNREKALHDFDAALYGHLRFAARNFARTLALGVTGSHFARVPAGTAPQMRRYYQQMTRLSSSLALTADVAMATLGGALKRKEKISARLGDVLSQLYVCSAVLWRFEREGRQDDDAPFAHFAVRDAMFKAQAALEGVIENFPNPLLGALMRRVVFPLGRPYVVPADALGHEVAKRLIEPGAARERLTSGTFIGSDDEPVGLLERALAATIAAEPIERRIEDARRSGAFAADLAPGEGAAELAARACAAGIVTQDELTLLRTQRELAARVIRVDDFARDLGASLYRPADGAPDAEGAHREDDVPPPSADEAANDGFAERYAAPGRPAQLSLQP